jgi:hypothetical protein
MDLDVVAKIAVQIERAHMQENIDPV